MGGELGVGETMSNWKKYEHGEYIVCTDCLENENEALRAELARLQDKADELDNQLTGAEEALATLTESMVNDELRREVERLKSLLIVIADKAIVTDSNGTFCTVCDGFDQDYEGVFHKDGCAVELILAMKKGDEK